MKSWIGISWTLVKQLKIFSHSNTRQNVENLSALGGRDANDFHVYLTSRIDLKR